MQHCDVVVVGAGAAGLVAAIDLVRAGLDVMVIERGGAPGGRLATDVVDGYRLDRGFQVLNTSYPQVRRRLDLERLDVAHLTPGALVRLDGRLRRVANPLRAPASAPATLRSGIFGPADLVRLAMVSAAAGMEPAGRLARRPDLSADAAFDRAGLSASVKNQFLRPFLTGVLLESELGTSRRYVDLVWRSFVRGASVLPRAGIGAVGAQLAGQLPPGVLRLNLAVDAVRADGIDTGEGTVRARAVVLAVDPVTAAGWLGLPAPTMHGVVTFYHRAPAPVLGESVLVLDGDAAGPVVNTVELSAALPGYAPPGHTLISSSVLDPQVEESAVRRHLSRLYGSPTVEWELIDRVGVPHALPAFPPGSPLRTAAQVDGVYIAGDHRATPSLQGAMASATAVARAVVSRLGG